MEQYLKRKRISLNLTQTEAAKKLGVTESTIQNWENGRSRPDISKFKSISHVYKVPVADLIIELSRLVEDDTFERRNALDSTKNLFPKDIKWDILDLTLSEEEQNVLFTLKIAHILGQNPMPTLCYYVHSMVELDNILDKLIHFGLLEIKEVPGAVSFNQPGSLLKITKLGYLIIDIIKRNQPIEKFELKNHLSIMEAFELLEPCAGKSIIQMLIETFQYGALIPLESLHSKIYQLDKDYYSNRENIDQAVNYLKENNYITIVETEPEPKRSKRNDWKNDICAVGKREYMALATDKTAKIIELLEE